MLLGAKSGLLKVIKNWITNLQSLKAIYDFNNDQKNNFLVRKYENSQTSTKLHRKTIGVCEVEVGCSQSASSDVFPKSHESGNT